MALLIVQALSEDTIAAPGNRNPNYIVASVTDANGVPITGLAVANFNVQVNVVGPGGAFVSINSITAGSIPGTYNINVIPVSTYTWKAGVYIFAVQVNHGADHGQALCSVVMD
jgi:hypothetical protein